MNNITNRKLDYGNPINIGNSSYLIKNDTTNKGINSTFESFTLESGGVIFWINPGNSAYYTRLDINGITYAFQGEYFIYEVSEGDKINYTYTITNNGYAYFVPYIDK